MDINLTRFKNEMILFINSIASHDWATLKFKCTILLVIYTCVLLAMIIDLISGVRKARQRGDLTTSKGLRMTVSKGVKYFTLLMLFTIADVVASIVIGLPYFTMIGGLFIVGIEIKSWFEKANEKDKQSMYDMAILLKNKDNVLQAFAEIIEKESKDKEDEKDK